MAIGYQGEPYSNSHRAVTELYPDVDASGYLNFPLAFGALDAGEVDRLVLPIENSTTGSILPVLDRLISGGVTIIREHLVEIHYAILGLPGAAVSEITTVHSHPEALRQAEAALVKRGWDPMPEHDTAGAVRLVAERGDPRQAALAPITAAAAYGLDVLEHGIVDRDHNTTRFVVVAHGDPSFDEEADKSSVAFETAHTPGALALALTELGLRGANLTRIESRPAEVAWSYRMFIDLTHAPGKEGFNAIFEPLPVTMRGFHHLGTYRSAS